MKYSCINLDILESKFSSGATVSPKDLVNHEMVRHLQKGIKVLGNGSLTKKLHVKAHAFSAHAREAIEKAGGKAELINPKSQAPNPK